MFAAHTVAATLAAAGGSAALDCTFGPDCVDEGQCRTVIEAAHVPALPWPPVEGAVAMTVDWSDIDATLALRDRDEGRVLILAGSDGPRDYRLRVAGIASAKGGSALPARLMTELRYADNVDVFAGTCILTPATDGN